MDSNCLFSGVMEKSEDSEIEVIDWYEKGRRYMLDGSHSKAIRAFNLAIDNKINCARTYFERGVCHYRLGNYLQAASDLEAAALLGCKDAFFWSKYETKESRNTDDDALL
ncbi:MAG: tetratricopeptide repeat protein [Desulfobacterales bacterium]